MSRYDDQLIIQLRKQGKTWKEIGKALNADGENVRGYSRQQDWYQEIRQENPHVVEEGMSFTKNANDEYSIESEHLFDEQKLFTNDELLELNNLDPKEFELLRVRRGKWSVTMTNEGRKWNFQSRIDAKPKEQEITYEYIQGLLENVQPRKVKLLVDEVVDSYLLVPLADMHFGINYAEDFERLKAQIQDRIMDGHREILIVLLGDYFNVDNLLNTTVRGTHVDEVNVEQATADAYSFAMDLIDTALEHSPCVSLVYMQGNHDSMVSYMFTQGIKRIYPQLMVDDRIDTYKHAWLGNHSIFLHHGDKIRSAKRLLETIVGTFPKEWGDSRSRYLFTGHFHHEKSLSNAGMTHYQVSSPSKASSYDKQNGFVTSEQVQMLFEFDNDKRSAIYYL